MIDAVRLTAKSMFFFKSDFWTLKSGNRFHGNADKIFFFL